MVALPPPLDAVTVYVACEATTVGVPEITPVDEFRFKPVGKEGLMENEVTGSPALAAHEFAEIWVPTVYVGVELAHDSPDGAITLGGFDGEVDEDEPLPPPPPEQAEMTTVQTTTIIRLNLPTIPASTASLTA